MKKYISLLLAIVMTLLLATPCICAVPEWTDKDAFGHAAPSIHGVKWLVAPTMGGKVENMTYNLGNDLAVLPYFTFYGTKNGVVDRYGNVVIPAKYESIDAGPGWFSASATRSAADCSTQLFNSKGKQVSVKPFINACNSSQYNNETYVLVNSTPDVMSCLRVSDGKEIFRGSSLCTFDSKGFAGYWNSNNKCGYFDVNGNKYQAPNDFTICTPVDGVLQCSREVNGKSIEGIYTTDFKPVIEFDNGKDSPSFDREHKIICTTNCYERCENIAHSYYGFDGKPYTGDVSVFDDYSNTISPDGYRTSGALQSGYFENCLGVKDPSGKTIVKESYSDIQYLAGTDSSHNCILACKISRSGIHVNSISSDIYDMNGNKLTTVNNAFLNQALMYRWLVIEDFKNTVPGVILADSEQFTKDWSNFECFYNNEGKKIIPGCLDSMCLPNCIVTSTPVSSDQWFMRNNNVYDMDGKILKSNMDYYIFGRIGMPEENDLTPVIENSTTTNGKCGFCDGSYNLVVPCVFDCVNQFVDGEAYVKYNGKWGIIDNPLNTTAEKTWATILKAKGTTK